MASGGKVRRRTKRWSCRLGPGRYRIEVRKDGYRSYTTMIDVRAGETAPINISLPRQ